VQYHIDRAVINADLLKQSVANSSRLGRRKHVRHWCALCISLLNKFIPVLICAQNVQLQYRKYVLFSSMNFVCLSFGLAWTDQKNEMHVNLLLLQVAQMIAINSFSGYLSWRIILLFMHCLGLLCDRFALYRHCEAPLSEKVVWSRKNWRCHCSCWWRFILHLNHSDCVVFDVCRKPFVSILKCTCIHWVTSWQHFQVWWW